MMDRDIPSVPITTLAGVTSLTDLLPEMPLPMPLPNNLSNKSLLFHPRVSEEALNLLRSNNDLLVPQLVQSLTETSADHINLKDDYKKKKTTYGIDHNVPSLLKTILKSNPNIFFDMKNCDKLLPQNQMMKLNETKEISETIMINHNNNNKILSNKLIIDNKDDLNGKLDEHNDLNQIIDDNCNHNHNHNNHDNLKENNNNNNNVINNNEKKDELPLKFAQFKQPFVLIKRISNEEIKNSSPRLLRHRRRSIQNISSSGSEHSQEEYDDEDDKINLKGRSKLISNKPKSNTSNHLTNNLFLNRNQKEIDMSNFKPKIKKIEKKINSRMTKLSVEEVMESKAFIKFNRLIDTIVRKKFESFTININKENRLDIQDLCNESAKLKSIGAMEYIPVNVLLQLLSILNKVIDNGQYISPFLESDENDEMKQRPDSIMDRIFIAAHASLTCLYIMTSPNISKRIHLEDIIELILLFIKHQLVNTIFPTFDPVYSLDSRKKDSKKKKSTLSSNREKNITIFYRHIHEIVQLLAELFNNQKIPDNLIIHATSMSLAPFFVENISELQLSSLKLATEIFTKYDSHRNMLIDEILISISRLPTGKRNLRSYRLNGDEQIQMLTALILQLIQSIVSLKEMTDIDGEAKEKKIESDGSLIVSKFDIVQNVIIRFLTTFLDKCGSKVEDIDFRPLFENFVQDLLTTLNKPEWPASELMLTYLGKMLMSKLRTRGVDMTLRVASLDYLGLITARLKRDAFIATSRVNIIDKIIETVRENIENEEETNSMNDSNKNLSFDVKEWLLQKILLDYLAVNSSKDNCYDFARFFYIAKWIKNLKEQLKKTTKKHSMKKSYNDSEKLRVNKRHNNNNNDSAYNSHNSKKDNESMESDESEELTQNRDTKINVSEKRRKLLLNNLHPYYKSSKSNSNELILKTYIDYDKAELITQYLSMNSLFSKNCDNYLEVINGQLTENAIAIRTKAMKCLSIIIDADPTVLTKTNLRYAVSNLCLDASASVREAAVDLIGKCVLSKHELITCYYETLLSRILDTAISVRKRVIKILKDLCFDYPEYDCIPEICLKMMYRVIDEEIIRKLIIDVFQNMWFTPLSENPVNTEIMQKKVNSIINVIAIIPEGRYDVFDQLLTNLFKPKDDKNDVVKCTNIEPPKSILKASRQIINHLIETILVLEEKTSKSSENNDLLVRKLICCLTTLYLFARVRPQLIINHVGILQPYLAIKCRNVRDLQILNCVTKILELVVPFIENPGDLFLSSLEEDSIKILVIHQDRQIISNCVALLAAVINVTKNYKLICDVFRRFYTLFLNQCVSLKTDLNIMANPYMIRTIFCIGCIVRYFDLVNTNVFKQFLPTNLKEELYDLFIYFLLNRSNDIQLQLAVLRSLGRICIRYPDLMLLETLKDYYLSILSKNDNSTVCLKIELLQNFELYLTEEENRLLKQDQEWNKESKDINLKEMGDSYSGIISAVIQTYLAEILNSYLHPELCSRHSTIKVVKMIIQHGLVLPFQIIPYLICMCTDKELGIAIIAENLITDIDKKYPGFIHTKAIFGIKLSYRLQILLQPGDIIRGIIICEKRAIPLAANNCLYSLIRSNRQQRRALVSNILKQFDDKSSTLPYMLYLADNLAYFPYTVQDEVLYIIHHIDIMISISGTNILQSLKEKLVNNKIVNTTIDGIDVSVKMDDDDKDMDKDTLMQKIPEEIGPLENCLTIAQGCYLLLILKQYLKDVYGLTDSKITQYSPSEPLKVYEKAINRKNNTHFEPKSVLKRLTHDQTRDTIEKRKLTIAQEYIHFKSLMMQFDNDESDECDTKAATSMKVNDSLLENNDEVVQINEQESPIKLKLSKSDIRKSIKANLKKANLKKKRKRYNSSSSDESNDSCSDYD